MCRKNFSVHLKGVSKFFGKRPVLQDITFIHKKGILGISGSNGSGKSTLMKCMAGLWFPSNGSIEWQAGREAVELADFKQFLGYAAPYINLYNELTCYQNLLFLLKLRNLADKEKKINKTLSRTGMKELSGRSFRQLSTGQQQRMRIAAALVHQPEALFLDEPVSNLDKAGKEMVHSIVRTFKEQNKFVAIASNNESELSLCDNIYSVEKNEFHEIKNR